MPRVRPGIKLVTEGGFSEPHTSATAIFSFRQLSCYKAPDGAATTTEVFCDFEKARLGRDALPTRLPTMRAEDMPLRSEFTGTRLEVMLAIL